MRFVKVQGRLMMPLTNFLFLLSVACFGTLAQADIAYVSNASDGTVSVINTSTNKVIKTINVGGNPAMVAISPDGKRAYVGCSTNNSTNHRICVIDTTTYTVIATPLISTTSSTTWGGMMVIRGNNFYVACEGKNICKIDMNTYARIGTPIPVGLSPHTIVIDPSNTRLYVTNSLDHNVSVINTATNTSLATIKVATYPFGAVITPDGSKVYVASQVGTVSVINTSNNSIAKTIPAGAGSTGVAINPAGTRIYVTNHYGGTVSSGIPSNTVSVIDTSTDTIIANIPVGTMPVGVSVNLSGTYVYVTNVQSNNVSVIDTITNKVVATIPVGSAPYSESEFIGPDPLTCKVESDTAKNEGIQTGITQCKTDPASYGLFTQAQIDAAKQVCKVDPASCGLFTQAQIDAAKQAGITQCKTTPTSCGITPGTPAAITKIDGISTNAFITPANKMIAGVLISGGTKRVMVRASSVDGVVDPSLEIVTYPDRKPLGNNDSWATDPAAAELTQKKLTPGRATDAATIINLPPGLFTMEVSSKNGGSGAGLIEVYDMAVFP